MTEISKILNEMEPEKNIPDPRDRIIKAEIKARKQYENHMKLGKYELALFFLARATAFNECLRYI